MAFKAPYSLERNSADDEVACGNGRGASMASLRKVISSTIGACSILLGGIGTPLPGLSLQHALAEDSLLLPPPPPPSSTSTSTSTASTERLESIGAASVTDEQKKAYEIRELKSFPAPSPSSSADNLDAPKVLPTFDFKAFKVPFNHENLAVSQFLGKKATIIFNMKIDDPQTSLQFPSLVEIFKKYGSSGLNVLSFPTEQGWFEPDDDETVRAKAIEYYGFGTPFPVPSSSSASEGMAIVFDKVDLLGPSAT